MQENPTMNARVCLLSSIFSALKPCRLTVVVMTGLLSLVLISGQVGAATLLTPPEVKASSYILYEPATQTILVESQADERLPPASLTKLMTSYVVASEMAKGIFSLSDMVPVSVKAWRQEGSRMFIREGTSVSVENLLRGMIIQSGNDASVALAEFVAGSEPAFADLMNQYAAKLGMVNSHFTNATGLPDDAHYMTARDLALLTRALITDHPRQYEFYREKEFTYNEITQKNRNLLLWRDSSVDGGKTGHTKEAGYCLVASAKREGMRLISVVMGTDSIQARAVESQKLLKFGFRAYELVTPFQASVPLESAPVWMGRANQVALGLSNPLTLVVPRGSKDKLKTNIVLDELIKAPISQGQVTGNLSVSLEGESLAKAPVMALESVAKGGIFKRLWHWFYLKFLAKAS